MGADGAGGLEPEEGGEGAGDGEVGAEIEAEQKRVGVRGRLGGEHHGRRHVIDLHVHPDGLPVLLDQGLGLLAELVARSGGVGEGETHAVLGANPVASHLPPGLLEDLLRLLGVVLLLGQVGVVRP